MTSKKTWRQRARIFLIEAMGGQCTCCGYNKVRRNLALHHLDGNKKEQKFDSRSSSSWVNLVNEARKCTLVCHNCHAEIHAGITVLPENYVRFNEEYANHPTATQPRKKRITKTESERPCMQCGKFLKPEREQSFYCSRKCFFQSRIKISTPSRDELETLIKTTRISHLLKLYEVDTKRIKKWCEELDIDFDTRLFRRNKNV